MGLSTKKIIGEEKELLTNLGLEIAKQRAALKMTRADLAKLSKLNLQYLYDVETGKRNITIYVLAKIARSLKTTPSELLHSKELSPLLL